MTTGTSTHTSTWMLSCLLLLLFTGSSTTFTTAAAAVIGSPPNITSIAAGFNFTEVDSLVGMEQNGTEYVLSITHSATTSDIIYSTIGTFNYSEVDDALTNAGTGATNVTGKFVIAGIDGVAGDSLVGNYTGATIPNVTYSLNEGIITGGTGSYAGAQGSILFNNTQTSAPTPLSQTQFTNMGETNFLATIQFA